MFNNSKITVPNKKTAFFNSILSFFKKNQAETNLISSNSYKGFDDLFDTVNTVVLKGTIIHSFSNDKATVIRIKTLDKHGNLPKVIFFGEAKNMAKSFKKYDMVQISGYVQSEKLDKRLDKGAKYHETSYVVGRNIEVLPEDDTICPNITYKANRLNIKGKVVDVYDMGNLVKINVKTRVDGYWNFVPLDYYIWESNKLTKLKNGDIIEAHGFVQTSQKQLSDKINNYQNFVIRQVKILPQNDEVLIA